MGQSESKQSSPNVNVTLAPPDGALGILSRKEFPCPLCGAGLPILKSKRNKPYCTCNDCGLQIFVRGKKGISRLEQMAEHGILISATEESAAHGISLLNRLEQLKLQKRDLQEKQGFFLPDKNVENAISLVDAEIENVQGELARLSREKQKENKT
jgi:DNA-directed RNA polymerase subunit RPC12/RpoP